MINIFILLLLFSFCFYPEFTRLFSIFIMEMVDKIEDDIIFVNCNGKKLDYSEEMPIIEEKKLTEESLDTFKNIVID